LLIDVESRLILSLRIEHGLCLMIKTGDFVARQNLPIFAWQQIFFCWLISLSDRIDQLYRSYVMPLTNQNQKLSTKEMSYCSCCYWCEWHVGVQGQKMWPPPVITDPSPPAVAAKPASEVMKKEALPPNYFQLTLRDSATYTAGLGTVLGQHSTSSIRRFFNSFFVEWNNYVVTLTLRRSDLNCIFLLICTNSKIVIIIICSVPFLMFLEQRLCNLSLNYY